MTSYSFAGSEHADKTTSTATLPEQVDLDGRMGDASAPAESAQADEPASADVMQGAGIDTQVCLHTLFESSQLQAFICMIHLHSAPSHAQP